MLADVYISPNPNPLNFCTSESEYIKKKWNPNTFFFKIEGIYEYIYLVRIHMNPFMA